MRVMLAMSGGVDSSVAGALLLEQGHEVVGVTMRLWGGDSDSGCCSVADVDDARRVAQQLGIDHVVFNFGDDFDEHVVQPYLDAHRRGLTPNPCIECNRHVKFDRLARRADLLGFDVVATGHHARIVTDDKGTVALRRGRDRAKDQSYVVHMIEGDRLRRTMFPVGDLTKEEVRRRAEELGLRTADKPDSQDVCFITATGGREQFLGDRIPLRSSTVVTTAGDVIGEVDAVELVTLGQRRGLGLPGGGPKRYVVDVDVEARRVTVGSAEELSTRAVTLDQTVWLDTSVDAGRAVLVQCSAHGEPRRGRLEAVAGDDGSRITIAWESAHPAVAPGQSVVLYDLDDDRVLGGGIAVSARRVPSGR